MNGDHFPNEIPWFFHGFPHCLPQGVCMYVYDIYIYGDFHKWGYPNFWMVCNGQSY